MPTDEKPATPKRRKPIKAWYVSALQFSLAGMNAKEIAHRLNQPERTVQRILKSDWAQEHLAGFNDAVFAAVMKDRIDPVVRFQGLISKSIEKLVEKLDCGDNKVEFWAACRLLDNAGFAPVKRVSVSEDEALKNLTIEELKYVAETGRLPAKRAVIEGECYAEADAHPPGSAEREGSGTPD